jgi:four helix bundle protein
MAIAQKEANETDYWIDLMFQSDLVDKTLHQKIYLAIKEINKIFASIIITAKKKVHNKK